MYLFQADMGESIVAVDILLKKHSDFEKTLVAQSDKIDALKKDADSLALCDGDYRNEIEKMYVTGMKLTAIVITIIGKTILRKIILAFQSVI